jgi:hypothetical protein
MKREGALILVTFRVLVVIAWLGLVLARLYLPISVPLGSLDARTTPGAIIKWLVRPKIVLLTYLCDLFPEYTVKLLEQGNTFAHQITQSCIIVIDPPRAVHRDATRLLKGFP